mmetsp:Transcript_59227/g.125519  ORF Transcript_59227/g.125519 Transcript_59227/m.125519 type:complete len:532 (+) Transcript_59227:313-1908(+)
MADQQIAVLSICLSRSSYGSDWARRIDLSCHVIFCHHLSVQGCEGAGVQAAQERRGHASSSSTPFQDLKDQLDVGSPHLLEGSGLGHCIEVAKDKVHTTLPQAMCDVHVCRLQDGSCTIDVDRHQYFLLTKPLQALHAELVCCHEKVHGNLHVDFDFVGIQVLQERQEDTMGDLRDCDGLLLGLPHLSIKHRPEVGATHAKQLVSVDRLPLHYEGDIRELLVIQESSQVADQGAARDLDVNFCCQLELPEIVQTLLPIVSTKDEQRVVVHIASVAEAWTRHTCLAASRGNRTNFAPLISLETEGIQIVSSTPCAASEQVHGLTANDCGVRVPWRRWWHLPIGIHQTPLEALEVELVEVVEMLRAIVTANDKHTVLVDDSRSPIASFRHTALHWDDGPLSCLKVVAVKITPVVAIVARKDIHGPIIFHTTVTVSRRRGSAQSCIYNRPNLVFSVILPEVVDSIVPIIPCEDVDPICVRHDHMAVPRRGRCTGNRNLRPFRGLETVLVEIVDAIATIVPAEDVQTISHCDASM